MNVVGAGVLGNTLMRLYFLFFLELNGSEIPEDMQAQMEEILE